MKPYEVARQGIARTFQNIALFEGMTVLDNVMTGRIRQMKAGLLSQAIWKGKAEREETSHGHLDVNGWCSSHDAAPSVSGSEVRARMHDAARFRARSTSHTVAQAPYRAVSAVQNSACGGLGSGG